MRILVTGTAGFIGAALAQRLLARGDMVYGFDNHSDYYDPALKEAGWRASSTTRATPISIEDGVARFLRWCREYHGQG